MIKLLSKRVFTIAVFAVCISTIVLLLPACGNMSDNADASNVIVNEFISSEKTYIDKEIKDVSNNNYAIAKYPVVPGRQIMISARIDSAACCAWIDEGGNRSLALQGKAVNDTGKNISTTLTVPATAVCIEISYDTSEELFFWQSSFFTDVKIGLLGDSIAENGGFLDVIVSELGVASSKNVAHGGWVYAECDEDKVLQKGVYHQVDELVGDETMIILWAGTNDFGRSYPVGQLGDTGTDTVCGGIHNVVVALHEKLGNDIPIIICTPLERNRTTDSFNSKQPNLIGCYLSDYANAVRNAAEHYGLLVFDSSVTKLDPNDPAIDAQCFDDGLHPK